MMSVIVSYRYKKDSRYNETCIDIALFFYMTVQSSIFMERSHMDRKNIIRAQFFSIWSQEWIALGKDTAYYVWTRKPLKSPISAHHWAWHVVLQPIAVDPGRVQVCEKGFRKDSVKTTMQGLLLPDSQLRTLSGHVYGVYFISGEAISIIHHVSSSCLHLPLKHLLGNWRDEGQEDIEGEQ